FIRSGPYFLFKIIKAGEILLIVKFHRLFISEVGFVPASFFVMLFQEFSIFPNLTPYNSQIIFINTMKMYKFEKNTVIILLLII
ncbi:hypothetical protein, partial [Lysinibacillus halotolerans]